MRITRRGILWAVGALLGIAVAVALAWSVGRLAGQRIGLSAAPPSVVGGLAPSRPPRPGSPRRTPGANPGTTASPPAAGARAGAGGDGGDGNGSPAQADD